MENYFNIPDSENIICEVNGYGIIFPVLGIKLSSKEGKHLFTIIFIMPFHIECPMKWQGANFRLGTDKERQQLIDERQLHEDFYRDRLYIVDLDTDGNSPRQVRILTSGSTELRQADDI